MKIIIPTMGTRGDVQPYIALATRLNTSGHEVTIATHPCWKDLIRNYNIIFVPIGPDSSSSKLLSNKLQMEKGLDKAVELINSIF